MSRLFGDVRQIGFVVRDIDAALKYWTEVLGVGPFFVFRDLQLESYLYMGKPSPPPSCHIALGNSGDLQVELIEQVGDEPSVYKDFLDAGKEGMHHVSSWLTGSEFDKTRTELLSTGTVLAQEGIVRGTDCRFAYFATDSSPGGIQYEISDLLTSSGYPIFEGFAKL